MFEFARNYLNRRAAVKQAMADIAATAQFTKYSSILAEVVGNWNRHERMPLLNNMREIARTAYSNPAIAFAVDSIADDAAQLALMATIGGKDEMPLEKIKDERIVSITNPRGIQNRMQTESWIYRDFLLFGHCYAHMITVGSPPRLAEMYRIPPVAIVPNWGKFGHIANFVINGRTSLEKTFPADEKSGHSNEIFYWRAYHPTEVNKVVASAQKAYREVNTMDRVSDINYAMANRGGHPSGILSPDGTGEELGGKTLDNLNAAIQKQQQDDEMTGKLIVSPFGIKFTKMGLNSREAEFMATRDAMFRDILLQYRIPPQLAGLRDNATYSNFAEARRAYFMRAVLPTARLFWQQLSRWLSLTFGEEINITPDEDKVPVIADYKVQRMKDISALTHITINEKRKMTGMKALDKDGDTLLVAAGLAPLADVANPPDPPPEDEPPKPGVPPKNKPPPQPAPKPTKTKKPSDGNPAGGGGGVGK